MRTKGFGPGALIAAGLAVTLTACATNGTNGAQLPLVPVQHVSQLRLSGSWMTPNVVRGELLYTTTSENAVHIYTYPQAKLIGSLTGFSELEGLCSDARGDVFVVDQGDGKIKEFAHGGLKPIATLDDTVGDGVNCASDPSSGDLAVANLRGHYGSGPGNVAIYQGARGKPAVYSDAKMPFVWFVGYDGQGDLFADGSPYQSDGFRLAELAKGTQTFANIGLNKPVKFPGNVQWDGTYMTVGNQSVESGGYTIYRTQGKKIAGTVRLGNLESYGNYLILGKTALLSQDGLSLFNYPAGGAPIKTFKLAGGPPGYIAVSKP